MSTNQTTQIEPAKTQIEPAKKIVQPTLVPPPIPLTPSEIMQRLVQCSDCD